MEQQMSPNRARPKLAVELRAKLQRYAAAASLCFVVAVVVGCQHSPTASTTSPQAAVQTAAAVQPYTEVQQLPQPPVVNHHARRHLHLVDVGKRYYFRDDDGRDYDVARDSSG